MSKLFYFTYTIQSVIHKQWIITSEIVGLGQNSEGKYFLYLRSGYQPYIDEVYFKEIKKLMEDVQ